MRGNETLSHITAALGQLGGYFVFADESGQEFVIVNRAEFDRRHVSASEVQLPLQRANRTSDTTAEEFVEKVNRDIAAYHNEHGEDELAQAPPAANLPPPRRVRFEPIRGDLPPELQE